MSDVLAKWMRHGRLEDKRARPEQPAPERRALQLMRREARRTGSFLTSGGKGGLPPSLVLGVMRRDGYRCKVCGQKGDKDNGGIGVHHKGGIVESRWLSRKGHANDRNNIVTICNRCHDKIHQKARAEGADSSQITPEGDRDSHERSA